MWKFNPIQWAGRDKDRYFGPFTLTPSERYNTWAIMLGSGDGDDYPGCRLRVSCYWFTIHVALPPMIKPWRQWKEIQTEPTRSKMIADGKVPGYWDQHEREYGFSVFDGYIHLHYGPQTHDSETTKSKCWDFPWRDTKLVRHSLYDPQGHFFADLPSFNLLGEHNSWKERRAIEDSCPTTKFEFLDYDGEQIAATCKIEELEYQRGRGLFRLLYLGRNDKHRIIDIKFSSEVGRRKGSWKGGTIGHSADILKGETPETAFRRYCEREGLTFVGPLQ